MDKYNDLYEGGSGYHRRLFLWFIAFVAALFLFNEREGGLFIANAHEGPTLSEYQVLLEQHAGENGITDLPVVDVELK